MSRLSKALPVLAPVVTTLIGCATYHPAPLPGRADLMPSVTVAASAIEQTGSGRRAIDPEAPLDEETVATIAILNNPDLKAARAKAGVANAQVFAAGLLPDPQLSVGLNHSAEHGGYDVGLSQELQSILTRGARREAAHAQARQVNLDILWQETQVAEKARELFIQLSAEPKVRELLVRTRDVLAKRYERDQSAMLQSAATATTVAADASALAGIDAQLRDRALQTNDADHALHALLGLQPDAAIHLGPMAKAAVPTQAQIDAIVAAMPKRRADLLALREGYASQEATVRAAILAQFPAVSLGVDRARSAEEGVKTVGLSISVILPLFNRNRGQIAIERATREQLRVEYQARLDQAVNDADRLWHSIQLLAAHDHQLEASIATMKQPAEAAEREFTAGNLTLDQYADLLPTLYAQEIEAIRVRTALAQADAALGLISGTGALSSSQRP
jgi:outer membrane protein TolC